MNEPEFPGTNDDNEARFAPSDRPLPGPRRIPVSVPAPADPAPPAQMPAPALPPPRPASEVPPMPPMPTRAYVAANRPPAVRAVKSGPGWAALIIAMLLTSVVTMALTLGMWGGAGPFSVSPQLSGKVTEEGSSLLPQSGAEVVEPVPTLDGVPDWEAVAAAVGPATVSIFVSGDNESASGSGVIIDGEGHVITNHHVVAGATTGGTITVTLNDGRLYSATLVGTDLTTDLAVLVLDAPPGDLTSALLGDSSTLTVGEPVMAIGAPLGLADTVTTGIISALDRPVAVSGSSSQGEEEVVITNAIQVDASINPGNSGGPLFNAEGAVIGINSSIASLGASSTEAGSIGLGFAIPVNLVKSVAAQIIETGSAEHAMLGVQISTGAVQVGNESRLGAIVAAVTPGSAAEQSGLQEGDVIVGIDGQTVRSGPSLTGYVRRYTAGDQVVLDVVRNGQLQEIPVILKQR